MEYCVLRHCPEDTVGVAIRPIAAGLEASVRDLSTQACFSLPVREDIPAFFKVALTDLPAHTRVIEYGQAIGQTTQDVAAGACVHVHNLKTLKW